MLNKNKKKKISPVFETLAITDSNNRENKPSELDITDAKDWVDTNKK